MCSFVKIYSFDFSSFYLKMKKVVKRAFILDLMLLSMTESY